MFSRNLRCLDEGQILRPEPTGRSLFRIDVTTDGVSRVVINQDVPEDRNRALRMLPALVSDIDRRVIANGDDRDGQD